jgi:hypothetical protein
LIYALFPVTGKRFLMIQSANSTPGKSAQLQQIHVVLNWTEELKRRVPRK